jgi:hypothetical protein
VAPLSTPFLAIKLVQRHVWHTACSNFPVEIVLHGRYFHYPDSQPVATFYYRQHGVSVPFYDYVMSLHNDSDRWTFDFRSVSPDVEVPPEIYPLISSISYDASNRTLSGVCRPSANASAGSEEVCLDGQYEDTRLSFNVTDTRTHTNYKSRVSDKQWYYEDNTDGPSLILHDVESDGVLGSIVPSSSSVRPSYLPSYSYRSAGF